MTGGNKKTFVDRVAEVAKPVEQAVDSVGKELEKRLNPERKSAIKRFPKLFTLLVAFGVAAVYYGFERMINKVEFLVDNPWIILLAGIVVLLFTGMLYKKL